MHLNKDWGPPLDPLALYTSASSEEENRNTQKIRNFRKKIQHHAPEQHRETRLYIQTSSVLKTKPFPKQLIKGLEGLPLQLGNILLKTETHMYSALMCGKFFSLQQHPFQCPFQLRLKDHVYKDLFYLIPEISKYLLSIRTVCSV